MTEVGRQGILLVAPLEGAVTGQAEISRVVAQALEATDKLFQINTNFESLPIAWKVGAQIGTLLKIISKSGRYDRVYMSFKRGRFSVLFDYLYLKVIHAMRPRLVVGHLHGNEMFVDEKPGWLQFIFSQNLKMCDQVICLNSYQKDRLATDFQVKNSCIVSNFSNLSLTQGEVDVRLSERELFGSLNVMYFSNLMLEKGIVDFLDVAEMAGQGVEFSVFGRPLNEGSTDAVAIRARLNDLPANTRYIGPVYGDERLKAWAPIDVILFPSFYLTEAQPLVIIEAMSMGIIPVVYDRPYASDLIPLDGDAGVRVPDRALDEIVTVLHRLRDEPERVIRMRRAAWASAQNFSRSRFEQTIKSLMLTDKE